MKKISAQVALLLSWSCGVISFYTFLCTVVYVYIYVYLYYIIDNVGL